MTIRIAFVLFSDFQQLDIGGPLAAFEVERRRVVAEKTLAEAPALRAELAGHGYTAARLQAQRPLLQALLVQQTLLHGRALPLSQVASLVVAALLALALFPHVASTTLARRPSALNGVASGGSIAIPVSSPS